MKNQYLIFRYKSRTHCWEYVPVDLPDELNIYFYPEKKDRRQFVKKVPIKYCMNDIKLLRNITGGKTNPRNIGSKNIGEFFYEYGLLKFKTIFYFI